MKLSELIEAQNAMQQLANQKMPAKVAYALAKNIRIMAPEVEIFEETRVKLLKENWSYDEKNNRYDIPPEEMKRWDSMIKEVLAQEVKLEPYLVDRSLLDSIQISPAEYIAISWMIKDED
jgi:hypothetical protein